MKRNFNLRTIVVICIFVVVLLLGTTESRAVLQSNATTHANPIEGKGSDWLAAIRQMETLGQTMGLTETLDADGCTATSENNHIDVHMMKPSEYGAIAILSASGFGNPGKLQDESNVLKRTTTGNASGVYFTGDRGEILACVSDAAEEKYWQGEAGYTAALGATVDWHGGSWNELYCTDYIYTKKFVDPKVPVVGWQGLFAAGYIASTFCESYFGDGTFNAWYGGYSGNKAVTETYNAKVINILWHSRGVAVST